MLSKKYALKNKKKTVSPFKYKMNYEVRQYESISLYQHRDLLKPFFPLEETQKKLSNLKWFVYPNVQYIPIIQRQIIEAENMGVWVQDLKAVWKKKKKKETQKSCQILQNIRYTALKNVPILKESYIVKIIVFVRFIFTISIAAILAYLKFHKKFSTFD